jgi:hypothetical protein
MHSNYNSLKNGMQYICQVDNGRVLGYDNTHGYHHKHYMGTVEPVEFFSFEQIEKKFQQEFEVLYAEIR